MKLNKHQRYALLVWLGSKVPNLANDHSVITTYDSFCNGEIREWRIICNFGMAGKLWNVHDEIYITGYSHREIGMKAYRKEQAMIDQWNQEIAQLLLTYR